MSGREGGGREGGREGGCAWAGVGLRVHEKEPLFLEKQSLVLPWRRSPV